MCGGSSASTDRKNTLASYADLSGIISSLRGTGQSLTSSGSSDTGKASKYFSDIVSGDPSKVMAAVAPEANTIARQADQQKKEMSQFGNRTGGKNAVAQDITTKARGQVADLISSKRGEAGGELGKIGGAETAAGINATGKAGDTAAAYGKLSADSRVQSQQIHDAAVNQWVQVAADLLLA